MYFQVIMPVGSNPSRAEHEEIIKKVANNKGINAHFPRYTTEDPVFNLQVTLQDIRCAQFVLSDLSLERPSCYYELGLAEALGKPVFLIAIKGTDIHQTASRRLVRFYDDNVKFENLVLEILNEAVEIK